MASSVASRRLRLQRATPFKRLASVSDAVKLSGSKKPGLLRGCHCQRVRWLGVLTNSFRTLSVLGFRQPCPSSSATASGSGFQRRSPRERSREAGHDTRSMRRSASVQADQDAQSLHTHQYRCGPHSRGHLKSHTQSYESGDSTPTCAFSSAWFQMLGIRRRRTLSDRQGVTARLLLCSSETPKASTQAVTEWSVIDMSGHHTLGCEAIKSNPQEP